ncbi:MAG: hypothetical protein VST64_07240, partial [Nitrospirota bacterium]|nr:hypothetical protein [Nitrospirota bacterium]
MASLSGLLLGRDLPVRAEAALDSSHAGFRTTSISAKHAPTEASVEELYGNLPLSFEPNRGQSHKEVLFLSRGRG